jgi:hypothetical protein
MQGQNAAPKDPCHAIPADGKAAKNFFTFDQFDKELRIAVTRQDPVAMAFLVTFPLRVNDAGGTISLNDPAALKTHFQEVFTPAVRKEILSEKNDNEALKADAGCNEEGVGYARGVIWVNASDRGYSIWSVNRDAVPPYRFKWNSPTIDYVCQTQTHRIVIDTVAGGALRCRSWNKPRAVTDAPDLLIAKGDSTFEGTQVCAYPVYTFKNGAVVYRIDGGLGCWGNAEGAPKDAAGRLEVTTADSRTSNSWCY